MEEEKKSVFFLWWAFTPKIKQAVISEMVNCFYTFSFWVGVNPSSGWRLFSDQTRQDLSSDANMGLASCPLFLFVNTGEALTTLEAECNFAYEEKDNSAIKRFSFGCSDFL